MYPSKTLFRPLPLCLVFYSRHHADVCEFSRTIPIVADASKIVKYYLHLPLLYPYRLKILKYCDGWGMF